VADTQAMQAGKKVGRVGALSPVSAGASTTQGRYIAILGRAPALKKARSDHTGQRGSGVTGHYGAFFVTACMALGVRSGRCVRVGGEGRVRGGMV